MMSKKNIIYWALYDFANSIIMIVFLFHFSLWLTEDSGKADWWWNMTPIISSLLFVLTAPVIGQRLDATGKKIEGLRIMSAVTFSFYLATALVAMLVPDAVLLATVLFTIGLYSYLTTFLFYNPIINDISTDDNRALVSGIGMGANYAGQVLGLLVVLPFATGIFHFFGEEGRAQTLLPAVLICGVLVLPMLLGYRKPPQTPSVAEPLRIKDQYRRLGATVRHILGEKNLALLLFGYFFVTNGLLTFTNNFPILLENVYAVPDTLKTYVTAAILTLSALGSVVVGRLADKRGHRRTLLALLWFWIVLFPLLAFSPSFAFAATICIIGGFLFGPVWSVCRAMIAELAPKELVASSFSLYIISERFAAFLGPFVWASVLSVTSKAGVMSYNYAVLSMSVLIVVGYCFMRRMDH